MKANYGIDAPTVVRNMLLAAAILFVVARLVPQVRWLMWPGFSVLATALVMIFGSKVVKLRLRDKLLNNLQIRGDEQVLDVGCGRGLMLIGAAKRLSTGTATGIDLWRTVDQSGNSPDVTIANAKAEGIESKIKIETGDMTKMPFPDNAFDVVLSSWAIHNIPTKEGRQTAIEEIVRVLKPGGRVAIIDIDAPGEYVETFRARGMLNISKSPPNFLFVIPSWTVQTTKPS
jgi:ubiquinone/menaquinone biosynthesis C-methylase UbiE